MDVRKKVLLDLFASPSTLLPIAGGLSALILSWAMEGVAAMNVVGLVGILGGVGWFATRLIFKLEEITNNAYKYLHRQEMKKQEEALDDLDKKLAKDRNPRTQECLRELRRLYGTFVQDDQSGKINRSTHEILEIVEELFRASVAQLRVSYDLWERARNMTGDSKENTLQERDQVVREVVDTIQHLDRTIKQFASFSVKENQDKLSRLRGELDEAMRVARRTDERLAAWDQETHTKTEPE